MSDQKKYDRRDFLKTSAFAAMALPAVQVVGRIGSAEAVESKEGYGGFTVKKHMNGNVPYQVDDAVYKRFDARNTAFSRSQNDPEYGKEIGEIVRPASEIWGEGQPGLRREDFSFSVASWAVAKAFGTFRGSGEHGLHTGLYQPEPLGLRDSGELYDAPWDRNHLSDQDITDMIKKAALFYGASLVGIAELDERWIYAHYTDVENQKNHGKIEIAEVKEIPYRPGYLANGTLRIPRTMNRVIVMAFEMDYDGIMSSLSGPAAAAVGMGYSRMAFTGATLAEFIRGLGFNALPCGNNTGLSVPMAVDAGLGELGRHGILITPKYGPRVRLAKVLTDMPLLTDTPISFGATEFCEVCGKCADHCPGEAISHGSRVLKGNDRSNNPGVLKWPVKATKCFKVWVAHDMDCGICIRTCPFNKPDGWLHKVTRILIGAESGALDKLLIKLDDASGYGERQNPEEFWKKDRRMRIKD